MNKDNSNCFPKKTLCTYAIKLKKNLKTRFKYFILSRNKKNLYLLGTEDFFNLGDHHIALSQIEFIKKYFSDYNLIEITASNFYSDLKHFKKYINSDDIIFTAGGGNCGDAYTYSEYLRRDIIKTFRHNPIIIFPQTVYYSKTQSGQYELNLAKSIYNKPNILFLTREETSYEFVKNNFKCQVMLYPDIVLFSNHTDIIEQRNNVLLCLRRDIEKSISDDDEKNIIQTLKKYNYKFEYIDTQYDTIIPMSQRESVLNKLLTRFASSKLVITDRLHGMIFCALTETPCIVISNYNYKVTGVYKWIKYLKYIVFIDSIDELDKAIDTLNNIQEFECVYDNENLLNYFFDLSKQIRAFIKELTTN